MKGYSPTFIIFDEESRIHADTIKRMMRQPTGKRKVCRRCSGSKRVKGGRCDLCFGEGFER